MKKIKKDNKEQKDLDFQMDSEMIEQDIIQENIEYRYDDSSSSSTTTTSTTTIKPKNYLYYIYFDDNEEYYSLIEPWIFLNKLIITKLISIKKLTEKVLNEIIEIQYRDYVNEPNVDFRLEKEIVNGVVIKCIDIDTIDWFRNEFQAQTILKERSLEVYKNIVPQLVEKIDILNVNLENIKKDRKILKNQKDDGFIDIYKKS